MERPARGYFHPPQGRTLCLVNAEVHFDVYFHWDWFSLQGCGLELVLLHRFDCFLIQAHAQVAHYLNALRISLRIDDQGDDADTLVLCPARFVGKLRIRREHQLRGGNAATHVIKAAAVAAAFTRTVSVSLARTDAATRAASHTRSAAAAVRGWANDAGPGVSQVRQVVVGELDVLGHHDRWVNRQLGMIVFDHHRRGDR